MKKRKRKKTSKRSIIESCNEPTPKEIYIAATKYRKSGLSFIPIFENKMPAFHLLPKIWCESRAKKCVTWNSYKECLPRKDEIHDWFDPTENDDAICGLAIIGGKVSGGLEILDLDTFDLIEPFKEEVCRRDPKLFERLVRVKTPRPGLHLYYRCSKIEGSKKLAMIQDPDSKSAKLKTIIETKGEGGYCLAPPSPSSCHPLQKCYVFEGDKDLTQIPTITPAERKTLLNAAKKLDRRKNIRPRPQRRLNKTVHLDGSNLRPGDDFNLRADWADILQPHGWVYAGPGGDGTDQWTRPGKDEGCSATTNYADSDLLHIFSSNAEPFDIDESYSKFQAFTLLKHDDDFFAAASDLRRKGYGKQQQSSSRSRTTQCNTRSQRKQRRFR